MMTGEEVNAYDAFLVFLNGLIVGVHTKPTQLVEKGVSMRLSTSLSSALHLRDYESALVLTALGASPLHIQFVSYGGAVGLESSCRCI
jgi:hypothetical protein